MNTQDITMKEPFQIELQQIFDEYHNPKWNDLEEIDKQFRRWNLNRPLKGNCKKSKIFETKVVCKMTYLSFLSDTVYSLKS